MSLLSSKRASLRLWRWAILAVLLIVAAGCKPRDDKSVLEEQDSYVYRQEGEVKLYVFKPAGWKPSDRRIGLVNFFGGGWTSGSPTNSVWTARWAAAQGFVAIAPDYRTAGRFNGTPMDCVADARLALRWVQERASELGVDPKRIVVCGGSAGAHLALWTAIRHSPPGSDSSNRPLYKPIALLLTSAIVDTSYETGYTPERFGPYARQLSPLHQLEPDMPPVLIVHGDKDATAPIQRVDVLVSELKKFSCRVKLVRVEGGGHDFIGRMPGWAERTHSIEEQFLNDLGL